MIFTIVAPGTVAGLLPWLIAGASIESLPFDPALDLGAWRLLGWPLVAIGAAGYLSCAFHFTFEGEGTPSPFDAPTTFVAVGLYRFVRNPMYVAVGTTVLGEALLYQDANLLLHIGALWMLFHSFVVFYEEPHLRKRFGAEYEDYRARVPRWIPRLTPAR
ncbi:MAG: methyltransferase family protein [Planctomycetota bacterium]